MNWGNTSNVSSTEAGHSASVHHYCKFVNRWWIDCWEQLASLLKGDLMWELKSKRNNLGWWRKRRPESTESSWLPETWTNPRARNASQNVWARVFVCFLTVLLQKATHGSVSIFYWVSFTFKCKEMSSADKESPNHSSNVSLFPLLPPLPPKLLTLQVVYFIFKIIHPDLSKLVYICFSWKWEGTGVLFLKIFNLWPWPV